MQTRKKGKKEGKQRKGGKVSFKLGEKGHYIKSMYLMGEK